MARYSHTSFRRYPHDFDNLVKQYEADRHTGNLSTRNQLTTLLYARISGLESLREIESAFTVQAMRTCHPGPPSRIRRNTLSRANAGRDCRIYEGMFYKLPARIKYQGRYSHSPYYPHDVIRAGLMERLSLPDTLNLSENRLKRIREGDLRPLLPFALWGFPGQPWDERPMSAWAFGPSASLRTLL